MNWEVNDCDKYGCDYRGRNWGYVYGFCGSGGRSVLEPHQFNEEPLKKTVDIIKRKRPPIFFLVMQKRMYKNPVWSGFCGEICQAGYNISWRVLSSRELLDYR